MSITKGRFFNFIYFVLTLFFWFVLAYPTQILAIHALLLHNGYLPVVFWVFAFATLEGQPVSKLH